MKNSLLRLLAAIFLLLAQQQTTYAVNVNNVKYRIFTYNPASPTVNPFKKHETFTITWADHAVNVANDNLYYMNYPMNSKTSYLTEAMYCWNQNSDAFGYVISDFANAASILKNGKPVIEENFPAGRLLVLGINPSNNHLEAFYNPFYKKVELIEYTTSNGTKIYLSKYSGEGKECCINLVIDLYPRVPNTPNPPQPPTPGKSDTTYNYNYDYNQYDIYYHYPNAQHEEFTYYDNRRGWVFIPQVVMPRVPMFIMPWDLFVSCMPLRFPRFCCYSGGRKYGMCVKTPETEKIVQANNTNITLNVTVNNSTTINNNITIPVIQEVPRPEVPRPGGMYNTGGGGDVTANNTDGGGGDTPSGTGNPTGGSGTGGDNTGAPGDFVGKKESDGWRQVDPRGNEVSRPVTQNQQKLQPIRNADDAYALYSQQPLPTEMPRQNSGQGNYQTQNFPGNTLANSNNSYYGGYNNSYYNNNYGYGNQGGAFQGTGNIGNGANGNYGSYQGGGNQGYSNTGIGNTGTTTNQTYDYTFNGNGTNSGTVTPNVSRPQGGGGNSGTIFYDQSRPATQGGGSFSGGQPEQGRPGQGTGNIPGRR